VKYFLNLWVIQVCHEEILLALSSLEYQKVRMLVIIVSRRGVETKLNIGFLSEARDAIIRAQEVVRDGITRE
jgi:hypothetical protein